MRSGVFAILAAVIPGCLMIGCSSNPQSPSAASTTTDAGYPRPDQLGRSIRPGRAIGPISLGEPRTAVEARLGPGQPDPIDPSFVIWPTTGGELAVTFDARDRVATLRANSPAFALGKYRVGTSLSVLRKALPSWKTVDCGESQGITVNQGPKGPSTIFAFYDGPPIKYAREIGFPIVQVSIYRTSSACIG